ncbi:MAG: N-acetylglucosamine-6-phosphate deacetylase [Oscillospiraceae bacterium]|nr:N-acetylglucosamine-6-phosphate deacetylase [Oscillospiraceae bacterium]
MIIKNCKMIFLDKIEEGSILIKNGKIEKINPIEYEEEDIIDGNGLYLSPGFIDVHIHGAGGVDTMDGSFESINLISKILCEHGTTSFLPTTMTCPKDDIKSALRSIKSAINRGCEGAAVLGVHLEGPFISPNMIGAQNPNFVLEPSIDAFNEIASEYLDIVKVVTLAPELEGALDLIKYLSEKKIKISIGHSSASFKEAKEGIKCGCSHATHLFNAMTGLHHREPGIIGAVFDSDITCETISDGIHVVYPALRITYKIKTSDKVLLVTDAMMACAMPEGKYSLGGQDVYVKDGVARIKSGSLAGSVLTLNKAVRNIKENSPLPLYEIVKMATYNPARHCGVEDKKGKIEEGFDADLILFDEDINISRVIINGVVKNKYVR